MPPVARQTRLSPGLRGYRPWKDMRSETGDGEERELRVRLGAHRGAPGEARQLMGWIGTALAAQRLAELRVIATELVTKAGLHGPADDGQGWLEIRLRLGGRRVGVG